MLPDDRPRLVQGFVLDPTTLNGLRGESCAPPRFWPAPTPRQIPGCARTSRPFILSGVSAHPAGSNGGRLQ